MFTNIKTTIKKKAENVYFSLSEAHDTIKNKIETLLLKNNINLES